MVKTTPSPLVCFAAAAAFVVLVSFFPSGLAEGEEVSVERLTRSELEDVLYATPSSPNPRNSFLAESFDSLEDFESNWIRSLGRKNEDGGKYDGLWALEAMQVGALSGDFGLVLKSKAKHGAIGTQLLKKPFRFSETSSLVMQYEVNLQNGIDCGGAYIKLLSHPQSQNLEDFTDKTPYSIMFGPDKCGSDSKLHFIIRQVLPNGTIEEKHAKKLEAKSRIALEDALKDKHPHLYRLHLHSDNTFDVSIDYKSVLHGSLFKDFEPSFQPPQEIDDSKDEKPKNWDEREKIPDPDAAKPEDWDEDQPMEILDTSAVKPSGWLDDEPEMIPDPSAEKPDDWDEEMDGEWEAPLIENPACSSSPGCGVWKQAMIDNPLYKGKWTPPLIENSNYKGKWKPRKIPNPNYFEESDPYSRITPFGAVGFELWSMSDDIYFDNILITDSISIADSWAAETFDLKVQKLDANDAGIFRRILLYSNRNPWLYAVYVVVVGLPLVLIVTFCCSSSSSVPDPPKEVSGKKNALNDAKKTDEVQEDDEPEEEEEEEAGGSEDDEENEEAPLVERRTSPRKRRARKD